MNWIDALINAELNNKDRREGVNIVKPDYKPQKYANGDIHGNLAT